MSVINDTSKKTSVNPKLPNAKPETIHLKPALKSCDSALGDINCSPPSVQTRLHPHIEPDSLLAAQREQLGRPELCDPVLRNHRGLPLLPDPYEEERRRAEAWQKKRHKHIVE